jgi:hypothetical protein
VPMTIWPNNPVLVGRLIVIPFALVEWGVVLAFLSGLNIFPKRSWQRTTICTTFIASIIGVVAAQIHGYQWITSRPHASDDSVVGAILIFENFVSAFLILYILRRRAKSSPIIG